MMSTRILNQLLEVEKSIIGEMVELELAGQKGAVIMWEMRLLTIQDMIADARDEINEDTPEMEVKTSTEIAHDRHYRDTYDRYRNGQVC